MERPKLEPIFLEKSEFCEETSPNAIKDFIPNQSLRLSELMSRFEKGQRLNVRENFPVGSNFTRDSIYEESFDDCPPDDVHDVVDVHDYYEAHNEHKREYTERKKAQKAPQKPAEGKDAPPLEGKDAPPAGN